MVKAASPFGSQEQELQKEMGKTFRGASASRQANAWRAGCVPSAFPSSRLCHFPSLEEARHCSVWYHMILDWLPIAACRCVGSIEWGGKPGRRRTLNIYRSTSFELGLRKAQSVGRSPRSQIVSCTNSEHDRLDCCRWPQGEAFRYFFATGCSCEFALMLGPLRQDRRPSGTAAPLPPEK
jgi:hypothetical protein